MKEPISAAVEGMIDRAVVQRLFTEVSLPLGTIYIAEGKHNLRKKLPGYNQAATFRFWFVLVDLNQEAPCAPQLCKEWLQDRSPHLYFRVAVRAVEAWLLADRESLADFLSVPVQKIPSSPDLLDNPKEKMIQLARESSSRAIQKEMVPTLSSGRREGPAYASRMIDFTIRDWDIPTAKQYSPSLQRCCKTLERLRKLFL